MGEVGRGAGRESQDRQTDRGKRKEAEMKKDTGERKERISGSEEHTEGGHEVMCIQMQHHPG